MDVKQYEQVISDAIQGEVRAKEFYGKVAERIKDPYLADLFMEFAREEGEHEKILTRILERGQIHARYFGFETDFHVSDDLPMPEVTPKMDLKAAIGLAMKNEEIAMKKYLDLAEDCLDGTLKKVFLDLASMEREHKHAMETRFVDVAFPEVW
ncbi:MAG: ferritin family protein [Desulfovibrionales bacterium]|nr:ferritin family protein [Desulfovibrionales bacterium]